MSETLSDTKKLFIAVVCVAVIGICLYIFKYHTTENQSEKFGHSGSHGHGGHGGRGRWGGWGRRGWLGDGGYDGLGYPYFYWDRSFNNPVNLVYPDNVGPQCVTVDKYDQCDILRPNKIATDALGSGIRNTWQCCATRDYAA